MPIQIYAFEIYGLHAAQLATFLLIFPPNSFLHKIKWLLAHIMLQYVDREKVSTASPDRRGLHVCGGKAVGHCWDEPVATMHPRSARY